MSSPFREKLKETRQQAYDKVHCTSVPRSSQAWLGLQGSRELFFERASRPTTIQDLVIEVLDDPGPADLIFHVAKGPYLINETIHRLTVGIVSLPPIRLGEDERLLVKVRSEGDDFVPVHVLCNYIITVR